MQLRTSSQSVFAPIEPAADKLVAGSGLIAGPTACDIAPSGHFGRTHPAHAISLRRAIHRLLSANSVCTWAAFFFSPR